VLAGTGVAEQILPEVPRLRLEADEHVRHKDVYQHTLTVLARAATLEAAYGLENDLVVRLAALLHDIGKPKTRRVLPGGRVTFHRHELAGAAMARDRLSALRFPSAVVSDVSGLVGLHLRFHGYAAAGWTDSAVRRYARDAGPLLTRLHVLTRADCTTRNKARALRLDRAHDDLERRIRALSAQEELDQIRPDLNGTEIMEVLGIPPGRWSGRRTGSCSSCEWSTARWAAIVPFRNCCAGPGRRAWTCRAPDDHAGRVPRPEPNPRLLNFTRNDESSPQARKSHGS
jgi:poly(A) polymerase